MSDEFDHTGAATRFIVMTLLGAIARTQTDPEGWLEQFRSHVLQQIDGWSTLDATSEDDAAFRRQATREAAIAILGSLSPRPPQIPGA